MDYICHDYAIVGNVHAEIGTGQPVDHAYLVYVVHRDTLPCTAEKECCFLAVFLPFPSDFKYFKHGTILGVISAYDGCSINEQVTRHLVPFHPYCVSHALSFCDPRLSLAFPLPPLPSYTHAWFIT